MRSISIWAKGHKWTSRFLIAGIQVLLTAIALFAGQTLAELSFFFHPLVFWGAMFSFLMVAAFYPGGSGRKDFAYPHRFYAYRKACDLLLPVFTFIMICFLGNSGERIILPSVSLQGASVATASEGRNASTVKDGDKPGMRRVALNRSERKALLKELKKQLRLAIRAGDEPLKNRGWKAALVLLSIVIAAGLLSLLAALACSLSCNGSEGAAIVVAILGTAGIITLLVVAIKAIYRRKKVIPLENDKPPTPGGGKDAFKGSSITQPQRAV